MFMQGVKKHVVFDVLSEVFQSNESDWEEDDFSNPRHLETFPSDSADKQTQRSM